MSRARSYSASPTGKCLLGQNSVDGKPWAFHCGDMAGFCERAPLHFLVIPKKHIPMPVDVQVEDEAVCGKMLRVAADIAREKGIEDSYRIVFNNGAKSGQVVFHLHMHILGGKDKPWPI
ncbi:unnamed protein product [Cyprideis torosa]|uniref:Uncharacterized protein n=1 Tax=Cyprideis torosa TaxID=163714 RepID=A0A7R8WQA4_9CRUS|nr:unnamed protein product [Cyprideis torosa]CAG0905823.1 unnamed protein product [Cyprideis torosa]